MNGGGGVSSGAALARQATGDTGSRRQRLSSPVLVGREEELATLVQALACPPAVVRVEGEAGIGKTRLISELQTRPELEDRRFAVGSCRRIREPFPLGPVVEAVRKLGDALPAGRLSPVAGALRPLLPELADLLPSAPEPLHDREAERHRVFRGLVEVLRGVGPAVVVLEDLHWTDEQTVDFVAYLLGDLPPTVSLVLTLRGEEADPSVRGLGANPPDVIARGEIVLAPLNAQQTSELAAAILGVDDVSAEFAGYLCERTSGVPFAIEEVLALLRSRGTLVRRSAGAWSRRALDELDVPAGIRDSVLERVSRLSPHARSVLEAAALLQLPASAEVITRVCSGDLSRVRAGLVEALESGLLVEGPPGFACRHVLAAQAVYEHIPGPRREHVHGRAASALEALEPTPLERVAHHLRGAGRLEEWAHTAEKAADQALASGHDTESARLLEDVLRHAPLELGERGRVAVKLGLAAMLAGRVHGPLELLTEVLAEGQGLPRVVRGELQLRLAMLVELAGGDIIELDRLLAAAVQELDERPDLRAWSLVARAIPGTPGIPLSDHLGWLHSSMELMPDIRDPVFEAFLLGKVAAVLMSVGDPKWRDVVDRLVARVCARPPHRQVVMAYLEAGQAACYCGHYELSGELLTKAFEGASFLENRRVQRRIRAAFVVLGFCRGVWGGLRDNAHALLREFDDEGTTDVPYRTTVACAVGGLALAHGDLDEAQLVLLGAMDSAERLGDLNVLPMLSSPLMRLSLGRGDANVAVEVVERLQAAIEPKGIWAVTARVLPTMTQTLVAAGRVADARKLVTTFDTVVRRLDAPLAPAATQHAHGLLKAAGRDQGQAAEHFVRAGVLYEQLGCSYEAAQAREQGAECLLGGGDEAAEELLRSALVTYQKLEAMWDLGRTARLARRHGMAVPGHHRGGRRGYGNRLSPRERAVAELAAAGKTNKEIARELFVSPSTVRQHVHAAMRKLGVRSRTVLAEHLCT